MPEDIDLLMEATALEDEAFIRGWVIMVRHIGVLMNQAVKNPDAARGLGYVDAINDIKRLPVSIMEAAVKQNGKGNGEGLYNRMVSIFSKDT